jgi:hypothetical protein
MRLRTPWNLKTARAAGFEFSDRPMTSGPLLTVSGVRQTSDALSSLPALAKFAEIEIKGAKPGTQIFLKTEAITSKPQIIAGYQTKGYPILLSALQATVGHLNVTGPSGSGKSTLLGLIIYQLIRLGFAVVLIGFKALDYILLACMKAAADSLTRVNALGKLLRGEFSLVTLDPDIPSRGISGLLEGDSKYPPYVRAARLLRGLGQVGGAQDPTRRYFNATGQAVLQKIGNLGNSMRDLAAKLNAQKLDRDTLYATAGLRHEIEQQAAIDVANIAPGDAADVNLSKIITEGGALLVDACSQVVGDVATAFGSLVFDSIVSEKRKVDPQNKTPLFVVIDEAQQMFRPQLKLAVEQTRGFNVRLLLAYHSPGQFGPEDWESVCMARTRIICGAVPGGALDQVLLPRLFGKEKIYPLHFGESLGESTSSSVTHSSGMFGRSISVGNSASQTDQTTFGFSEKDEFVWGPNETLELNCDAKKFVLHVSPPCDFADFGPKAIVCERGAVHLTESEIKHFTDLVLKETKNTTFAAKAAPKQLPELSQTDAEKRSSFLRILDTTYEALHQPN